jgi:hypothetical protein
MTARPGELLERVKELGKGVPGTLEHEPEVFHED